MTILPAMFHKLTDTEEFGKRTDAMLEKIAEGLIFYNHKKDVEEEYGTLKIPPPKEAVLLEGYLLPEFEKLKKDPQLQDKFLDALAEAYHIRTWPKERLREYLKLAIDAAEEVSKYLGKAGKSYIPVDEFEKFEKLNKFLDTLFTKEFHARKRKPVLHKTPVSRMQTTKPPLQNGWIKSQSSEEIHREATKLLGVIQGLKIANAGEEALRGLEKRLWNDIRGLGKENLELAGLYAMVIAHLRENDLEGAERFLLEVAKGQS